MKASLKMTFPVLLGHLPVGITFGYMLSNMGHDWWYSIFFALFVYAGAAQFMALNLLSLNSSIFDIFLLTFLLNFRHIFYGISLVDKLRGSLIKNFMIIFGLTDETYSLVTTEISKKGLSLKHSDIKKISLLNYLYWIAGCSLGGLLGSYIKVEIKGLEFIMTALFTVLAYEQFMVRSSYKILISSISIGVCSFYLFSNASLLIAIAVCAILLIAIPHKKVEAKDG